MRFANLYVRTVALASLILAVSACQTAQKPVSLLPPTTAPSLKPAQSPATTPAPGPQSTVTQEPQGPAEEAPVQKPASPQVAPTASAPASDPVADLIARAEKEYQAGLANNEAGKTEEAKQNFDNALNALLSSNLDVRSDERLQKEFDRMVAGRQQLYPGGTAQEADARRSRSRSPNRRPSTKPTKSPLPPMPASRPRPKRRSSTHVPTCR